MPSCVPMSMTGRRGLKNEMPPPPTTISGSNNNDGNIDHCTNYAQHLQLVPLILLMMAGNFAAATHTKCDPYSIAHPIRICVRLFYFISFFSVFLCWLTAAIVLPHTWYIKRNKILLQNQKNLSVKCI